MDNGLSSMDLLVAMKLAVGGAEASVRSLELDLGLSKSAVANSLHHLAELGLVKNARRSHRINKLLLRDCLEHGIRWIAPARVGDYELGLPTAHAAEPLKGKLTGDEDVLVIPLPHGPVRGRSVSPLHPLAPRVAERDPNFHRLLAVVDALRIGRARDRQIAATELRALL